MATTPRLGLRLLEGTDVANYELINQLLELIDQLVALQTSLAASGGHDHNGTDGNGPKISYASITGSPVSLPANGGNADTVDSMHAADFASAQHDHTNATASAAGFLSSSDKANLDTLISRIDQPLKTTSSPTFNVVTAQKVIGAVYA